MTDYIAHFLERPEQIPVVLAAVVLWLALASLGSVVAGRDRAGGVDVIGGWAAIITLFTLAGVFSPLSFTALALMALAVAAAAAGLRWQRERRLVDPGVLRMAIIGLPLILLASAMQASQWDEFAIWLPSTRFLIDMDGFPNAAHPQTGSTFPAYPYGWTILSYLVARLTGGLQESSGALLNVMLLLTFALLMTGVIRQGAAAGRAALGPGDDDVQIAPSWGLCALAALAALPFNPTFAQKIVLTYYADTASAVALGFATALGWMALNAASAGQASLASRRAWQAGLSLTVLVALKQAAFVLFLIAVGSLAVAALRDPAIGWRRLIRLIPGMILLPLLAYGAWRYHVATQLGSAAEFVVRPFDSWSLALIPDIVMAMATVLVKKGLYLALMLIAIGFGLRALWRCRTAFDRLALVAGGLFAGYNGFLFFAYVAAFGANDALRAGSLWRYNMHLGAVGVVFAWFAIALAWTRFGVAQRLGGAVRWLPAAAVVLVVAAPFAFAGKLRFDSEPDKPYYRTVARSLAATIPAGRRFSVLDPLGSGESWVITLFQLGNRVERTGYLAAFSDTSAASIRSLLETQKPDAILVHSVTADVIAVFGPLLRDGAALTAGPNSYLLLRDRDETWRIAQTWTRPGT